MSHLGISGRHIPLKIAAHAKRGFTNHWKFPIVHTGMRLAHGFQPSVCIRLTDKAVEATSEVLQNDGNENVRSMGQGGARHGKYERLKLGGGQAYDHSTTKLPYSTR